MPTESDILTADETELECDELTEKLAKEWSKETPKRKRVLKLMGKTFAGRRKWIVNETPVLSDIVKKFPGFHMYNCVS